MGNDELKQTEFSDKHFGEMNQSQEQTIKNISNKMSTSGFPSDIQSNNIEEVKGGGLGGVGTNERLLWNN